MENPLVGYGYILRMAFISETSAICLNSTSQPWCKQSTQVKHLDCSINYKREMGAT